MEFASAPHRGITLAMTSAFMSGGFGSAVASWVYPLAGFYGPLGISFALILLAFLSMQRSEKLRKAVSVQKVCQNLA